MLLTNLQNKTVRIWNYLKGEKSFSLQSRIYNSVCVVTIAVMVYNVPFSLALGLYDSVLATLVLIPLQFYLYYLSRFKGKTALSSVFLILIVNLFFAVSYSLNSGIQGSSLLSFSISYFVIIAIVPRRQYWFWTIVNISLVMGLIIWEYYHPELVSESYPTRADRFIDIASTYIMNIILTFSCLSYIINNYSLERVTAEASAAGLAQLNQQKNKLITIISHDFNAPLNNINSYLYVLSNRDLNLEDKKKYENELKRITFDTQNLLLNLLNWSKSNMEGISYVLEEVNLNDAMNDTLNVYQSIAVEKEIRLAYEISADTDVIANFELVEIIFRNLISNAIKFTPRNGIVRVFSSMSDGFHIISVSDTGPGIPSEKQIDIFTTDISPTFGTARERGAGLGLKICDEFVQYLGGEIWFDTIAGLGTTFSVKLPAA